METEKKRVKATREKYNLTKPSKTQKFLDLTHIIYSGDDAWIDHVRLYNTNPNHESTTVTEHID